MALEEYENDLLMECEALDRLVRTYRTFDEVVDKLIEKYADYLDTPLVMCVEIVRYEVNLLLSGTVVMGKMRVPGLLKQLEDALDEVQITQAGGKTHET